MILSHSHTSTFANLVTCIPSYFQTCIVVSLEHTHTYILTETDQARPRSHFNTSILIAPSYTSIHANPTTETDQS